MQDVSSDISLHEVETLLAYADRMNSFVCVTRVKTAAPESYATMRQQLRIRRMLNA